MADEIRVWRVTYWVGLIGGIGSGKTAVSDLFAQKGVPIIDTDIIAHTLTAARGVALPALQAAFPELDLLDETGKMNRRLMRETVLADGNALQKLENILHPLILSEAKHQQQQYQSHYGLVVLPLLVEKPIFHSLIDRVLLVDCSEEQQIKRVMKRGSLDKASVIAMMALQATREQRRVLADDILDNSEDAAKLPKKVAKLDQFYKAN